MFLLNVEQEKCNRDGICIETCPAGIIEFKAKDAFPTLIDSGESVCIYCGHCVAVCPFGAMSHKAMQSQDCPPVRKELRLTAEQMEQFLRYRRSIRTYRGKTVEKSLLKRLIEIARYAPTARNLQPVNWLVIYDRDEVQNLAGMVVDWMRHLIKEASPMATAMNLSRAVSAWESGRDGILRSAPHLIVTYAHKKDPTAQTACTIALTYLELAAVPLGLGACWAGYFNGAANFWPPLQAALKLPEGHGVFGAMMVGYPKFKYHRLPLRNEPNITWR